MRALFAGLDRFYRACGFAAAFALMMIAVLMLAQAVCRWLSVSAQGLSEYAGYMMAASSFLAFAPTFRRGGHIRVMLLLDRLSGGGRRALERLALALALGFSAFLAAYCVKFVWVSYAFGEISEGSDATPLWIARLPMAIGAVALAVAVLQTLIEDCLGWAGIATDHEAARTE